jgi:predicted dinucleotide-binding enzyme
MNILFIGGTGFIGSYVVRHSAQQGHRVGHSNCGDAPSRCRLCGRVNPYICSHLSTRDCRNH